MDPATMAMLAQAATQIISNASGGGGNKKISNYDKNQQRFWDKYSDQAQNNLGGRNDTMQLLQSMLDPNSDFYKNFENQQIGQFNEETIPNLFNQFSKYGAESGALTSSGFGQALGSAGAGLQRDLAAGKSGMIMQALQQLMSEYNNQANTVLGAKPFDIEHIDKGGGIGGGFKGGLDFSQLLSGFQGMGGYKPKYSQTAGYNQEFRANPSAMGY